ncbi:MAG: hypothetical protein JW861_14055, partial [Bacteroidales bacterium]|nr:hypothetical protein [Bacteroidales bacterium]
SYDGGQSWTPVFDEAASLSIGDIAIAPSDPGVIYAGTGEANAGGGSLTYDGIGIYCSGDGGDTWEYRGLPESRNIGRMAVHPADPFTVYVAAMGNLFSDTPERGIYKTTDGGATWHQSLFVSDSTGGIDVVIDPEHPDTVYAAMWERVRRPERRSYGGPTCGIYRSFNGGADWTELVNGLPSPSPNMGRIGIDICRSQPNVLYAIYADKSGYFEGVYKTSDFGGTWLQTNDGSLVNAYYSYGWWFGRIAVDPADPQIAYVIGFDLYKTQNGGSSWSNVSAADVHVDQHGLYIHPLNHQRLFLANDGGFYLSQNGAGTWDFINVLPVTQFYTCEVDYQHPERLYGGTQDNGTNRTLTGGTDDWENIYGGDGFYVLVDPVDNSYVYAEYQYGSFARSTNGGNSFSTAMNGIPSSDPKNWNTPVVFDPQDPAILYYGSNKVYRTTNHALSWSAVSPDLSSGPAPSNLVYGTITTLAVSPADPDIIWAGTDDSNVWVTLDGGGTWQHVSGILPQRWVTRVAACPLDALTAFVTFSGYRYDEFLPHIFRTTDAGQTWSDISGDLPESPVNDIIPDPSDVNTLYAATDMGVYVTRDLGQSWQMLGSNLPLVPVCDLTLHQPTRKLVAGTYGRSMYTYDLFQDTVTTGTTTLPVHTDATLDAWPNPCRDVLNVKCAATHPSHWIVDIISQSGERTAVLYDGELLPGESLSLRHSPEGVTKGIFLLRMTGERVTRIRKVVFLAP